MVDLHIYVPTEIHEIVKKMDKGEPSALFQKAVKEWDSYTESIELIQQKITVLNEQDVHLKTQLCFLNERLAKLKETEADRKERQSVSIVDEAQEIENDRVKKRLSTVKEFLDKFKDMPKNEKDTLQKKFMDENMSMYALEKLLSIDWINISMDSWERKDKVQLQNKLINKTIEVNNGTL